MSELVDLVEELEVPCLVCHHGYTEHEAGGGHCRAILSNGPMHRLPCMCPGMRWVPLPSGGQGYLALPSPSYGEPVE